MNPPLKILILNFRDLAHPGAGGAEVFTEEISKRLVRYGNEVTIFTSAFDGSERESIRSGIKIVRDGGRYSVYRKGRRFVKRHGAEFDLIIDEINTIPFQISKIANRPVVALIHQLAREVWFHETWFPLSAFGYFVLEDFWLGKYRKNPTITVSESTRNDLLELGFTEVNIVRNGIGVAPLDAIPEKCTHPVLIFVGRMVSSKHPDHAVRAFSEVKRRFPNAELWILGNGYLKTKLERHNIGGVKFLGHVSDNEKYEMLRRSHVLLSPSVREGWGATVLEANAMGTPAVGYDVHGLRDSIINGKTGLLVEPNDPSALAQGACQILADNQLAQRLSQAALDWSRRFNWDESAMQFLSFLASTCKS